MNFHILALVLMTSVAHAQSIGAQDVEPMLQQMHESGRITKEQMEVTRKYMKTMSASDWKNMEHKAEEAIKRNPAAAEKVSEEGMDALHGEDFGINDSGISRP